MASTAPQIYSGPPTMTTAAVQPGTVAGDLSSIVNLGQSLYGLYNSSQQNSEAQTIYQQSNPFGAYRPTYGAQLLNLIQNPSSVSSLPGYQFLMGQGAQAIDRSSAAAGALGSGQEMTELTQYGQGLADQFYNQQVSTLAHLAGADISPANPAQALQAAAGTQAGIGSDVAGLLNSLPGGISAIGSAVGGVSNLLSKLFPGSSSSSGAAQLTNSDFSSLDPYSYNLTVGAYDPNDPFSLNPTYSNSGLNLNSGTIDTSGLTLDTSDPLAGMDLSGSGGAGDLGGGLDLSGLFSGFNGAGGQAANPNVNLTQIQQPVSNASTLTNASGLYGVGTGLASGTPTGYASAGLGAAQLAAKNPGVTGLTRSQASSLGTVAGEGANVLGIYQGIEQGGVVGDTEAAANSAALASKLGAFGSYSGAIGTAAGYVAAPLALYEAAENWQSGSTGSDALSGAEAGASIGSIVGPIGTLVGGVIGGAVGAISSAFGGGKNDPETLNWDSFVPAFNKNPAVAQQLSPSQSFQLLAGTMDAKTNKPGSAEQIEQKFGRMGESSLVTQMAQRINSAITSGNVAPSASPEQIYNSVVEPWLSSQGVTVGSDASLGASGDPGMIVGTNQQEGNALQAVLTNLIGDWQSGTLTANTPVGVSGQTISSLPSYAGAIVSPQLLQSIMQVRAGGARLF